MPKDTKDQPTILQQIVQHAVNKEPSKIGPLVNKEISARVMARIDDKRQDVGKKLFSR